MSLHASPRICVNLLTGFLGSGKTTLLKRLLGEPAFADCALLINEIGEVGLDHHLLERIDHETIVLQNGCICCSVRDDLRQALLDLHDRRARGAIPPFTRVVIESTGLADPAPVLNAIASDPVLRHHYRLGNVVTTVDAVHALDQLARQAVSRRQAAVADRLVLTKADLVDATTLHAVQDALRQLNGAAWITVSHNDAQDADILLTADIGDADTRLAEVRRWFAGAPRQRLWPAPPPVHAETVSTLTLTCAQPIDWAAFGIWMTMLLHRHGADILRIKGMLNVQGSALPLVVHGVQHMVHAPVHLSAWPGSRDGGGDDLRHSQLVLIGRLPPREAIEASWQAFLS